MANVILSTEVTYKIVKKDENGKEIKQNFVKGNYFYGEIDEELLPALIAAGEAALSHTAPE